MYLKHFIKFDNYIDLRRGYYSYHRVDILCKENYPTNGKIDIMYFAINVEEESLISRDIDTIDTKDSNFQVLGRIFDYWRLESYLFENYVVQNK